MPSAATKNPPKPSYDVFIDSDAFMALLLPHDNQHHQTLSGFQKIKSNKLHPVTSDLVLSEAASILSNRIDLKLAQQFLRLAQVVPILPFEADNRADTIDLFLDQTKQKTSFVDMANVVLVREYKIPTIFSFDGVYPSDFDIPHFVAL